MKNSIFINKNYTKLITATFITRLGDAIEMIAFSWLVYVMTGSRVLMGTIFAVSMIPNIIILPFGGVVADTFNKKKITVIGDISRALIVSLLAFLYFSNILEVWHLFVFAVFNSSFESFANPARGSMMQSIIKPDQYVKGSSYLGSIQNLGSIIGLAFASIIIGTLGIEGAIFIDAITFFFSGILIAVMQVKYIPKKTKQKVKDYLHQIKDGFMYVFNKKVLFAFVLLAAFINFSLVPFNVLRPIYVTEVLDLGVEGLSLIGIAMLVGMFIGGILVGKYLENANPIHTIGIGIVLLGVMYALLGIAGYLPLDTIYVTVYVFIISVLFGGVTPLINGPLQALILRTTDESMIGRLSSILGLVSLAAMPLGGVMVSVVGDAISVPIFFIIMGTIAVIVSLSFWLNNRKKVLV